jgi:hypothetical protein
MSECRDEENELRRTWVSDRPDENNPFGVALASSDVPAA